MVERLTPEEIDQCRRVFSVFDINKDNTISTQELGKVLRSLNLNPSNADLQNMVRKVDSKGSGRIDFTEFVRLYAEKAREPITQEEVQRYFLMFDKNGDGRIDPSEFRKVITTMGEPLTEDEVDFILNEADPNGEGFIDYNEFCKILIEKVA